MQFRSALILFSFVTSTYAYNILFYNAARIGQSHVFYVGRLADWLSEAGHNVTFYQQDVAKSSNKVGVKLARAYVRPQINFTIEDFDQDEFWTANRDANLKFLQFFGNSQNKACVSQLNDDQLIAQIKSEKYDFAVVEYFDCCAYAIIEKAGIKKYGTASALMLNKLISDSLGLPLGLGVIPNWNDDLSPQPTFSQRLHALIGHYTGTFIYSKYIFGPLIKTIKQLHNPNFDIKHHISQSSYIFVNSDEHLALQQPITSKILYVGGTDAKQKPIKALNHDIQKIVDSAEEGVVLVSFGTVAKASEMPKQLSDALVDTFKTYPKINFIWKYEVEDTVGANVTNLFKRPWVPQHDLLGNKKILAFITHGGLNSISETAEMGVPTVCIPVFGDQPLNCQAAQAHGISIMMDKATLTAETLKKTLDTVMHDQSMRKKVKQMADLINHKPIPSKERFVKHVEHAIRFNVNEALDMAARSQGFVRGYNLDFIAAQLAVLATVLIVFYYSTKLTIRMLMKIVYKLYDMSTSRVGLQKKID
ncbi:unnamed protein product [Bursaphelenchus okinawaensis]|uniref:UDP-glucuronosyltransferase n=1 Tax=Bursaphelenchus okinawaensis TaxID=465554 RepID=A0A811K2F4_9BILA|nr:unnamed protein product [Bursaphelenchus okinawaensis]CAG9090213.1 unnamed protein product [Bursaphelenchus okinawaensis]